MMTDLLDSLLRPRAYPRFAAEKKARTASYIAFLSLIFVGALGIAVKLRLAPFFTETFTWLETTMPTISFSNGVVTSAAPGPLRLEHPRGKELAVMIDTARKETVSLSQMKDANVLAYLTANALYLQRGEGRIEAIDLTKSTSTRPVVVDSNSYKELERAFNWIFYPGLLLFFFVAFAASLAATALMYALIGLIFASVAGGAVGFGPLYRIGVHVQTAGCLLYSLDAVSPRAIPFSQLASFAASLVLLWLGIQATVSAAQTAPAAPA
jgi:hypothetical protein